MVKYRYLIFCVITLVCSTIFVACDKDDEETETKNYLVGEISTNAPAYTTIGATLTLTASGIVYPPDIKYTWLFSKVYPDTIPSNPVSIHMPDSIGDYSLTAVAIPGDDYRDDYYSEYLTFSITVLDTALNQSLTGLTYDKSIIDQRDGKRYHIAKIGNLEWFTQNLAWGQSGTSYYGSDAIDALFGRFYTWNEATGGVSASGLGQGPQGVCPQGWRIPTNEDWADLASSLSDGEIDSFFNNWNFIGEKLSADAYLNGSRMWPYSPDNIHTNVAGFNAIPAGNVQHNSSLFRNNGEYAFWWSASEKNENQAYYRYIYYDLGSAPYGSTDKSRFGATVRCIRFLPPEGYVAIR